MDEVQRSRDQQFAFRVGPPLPAAPRAL